MVLSKKDNAAEEVVELALSDIRLALASEIREVLSELELRQKSYKLAVAVVPRDILLTNCKNQQEAQRFAEYVDVWVHEKALQEQTNGEYLKRKARDEKGFTWRVPLVLGSTVLVMMGALFAAIPAVISLAAVLLTALGSIGIVAHKQAKMRKNHQNWLEQVDNKDTKRLKEGFVALVNDAREHRVALELLERLNTLDSTLYRLETMGWGNLKLLSDNSMAALEKLERDAISANRQIDQLLLCIPKEVDPTSFLVPAIVKRFSGAVDTALPSSHRSKAADDVRVLWRLLQNYPAALQALQAYSQNDSTITGRQVFESLRTSYGYVVANEAQSAVKGLGAHILASGFSAGYMRV